MTNQRYGFSPETRAKYGAVWNDIFKELKKKDERNTENLSDYALLLENKPNDAMVNKIIEKYFNREKWNKQKRVISEWIKYRECFGKRN